MDTTNDTALAPQSETAEVAALLADERTHWTGLSLQEWYLKVLGECDMMEQRVEEQAAKLKAQIAARRKALEWRWGPEFRQRVAADLERQSGKRKSIEYATGRAGFRTTPAKLVVVDSKALIDWASVNVPEAVKLEPRLHVTPIKAWIEGEGAGEEPPGCRYIGKEDRFYPAVMNREIGDVPNGAQERANGLPGESSGAPSVD